MSRPKLQVALDHSTLHEAVAAAASVGDIVDVIECGTVLLLQVGDEAIKCMRALYPYKTIVADTKCADAGTTVARNVACAGADLMTCICCATPATMQAAAKEVRELQIELYGDWTFEQAQLWLDMGITQVVYHQSRDALLAGETWGKKDLDCVKKLISMGFKVSVTGGLNIETLPLFKGVDVFTFIAGRGITEVENPREAAQAFQDKITELWGD